MATYFRLTGPGRQYFDDNGDPANGYQLFTYIAGTSTKVTTYKDNAGAASHTNPIILGSDGKIPGNELWVLTGSYKLVLASPTDTDPPSSGETLSDNLVGVNDVGSTSVSEWVASGITPTRTSNTTFTMVGDQTTAFHPGRRLQFTDSSTLYGTITASTYSAPDTTVTVVMDSGTLSASLSAVSYGIVSAANSSLQLSTVQEIEATPFTLYGSGSTAVPADDTIPQNTEGTDTIASTTLPTVSITPTNANNRLVIEAQCHITNGDASARLGTLLIFQDSDADAIGVSYHTLAAGEGMVLHLSTEVSAGATTETTFKMRIGMNAGTYYVNGSTTPARIFGGALASRLRVREVRAY